MNQQILAVQVNEVELRTIKCHPQSQECLSGTPVDLAPVVVQGVSHLAMFISDDDEFTDDPHEIIPTEDAPSKTEF